MSSIMLHYLQAMSWLEDEEGQGLVEYVLILFLISIVAVAVMTTLGGQIQTVFTTVTQKLGGT